MILSFLTFQNKSIRLHHIQACAEGRSCAPRARDAASQVLALFGLQAPTTTVCITPPVAERLTPTVQEQTVQEQTVQEQTVLAEIVLLVAKGLRRPLQGTPCLAVGMSPNGFHLAPIVDEEAVDDELIAASDGPLWVYDRRSGEGRDSMAERVRARAEVCGAKTEVVGVETLEHALTSALGGVAWRSDAGSAGGDVAVAAAAHFDVVLRRAPNPVGWTALAAIATGWLIAVGQNGSPLLRWKLGFVRDVARRHQGESVLPAWPDGEVWDVLSGEEQLAVAAHLVQGAADAALELVPAALELAHETLGAQRAPSAGAAELWGAMGRAEAARGELGQAIAALRRAVEAWRMLSREDHLSFAASELLRVSSLVCLEAREAAEACKGHSDTGAASRGYVVLAEARAEVLHGRWEHALALLEPTEEVWQQASEEVDLAVLRWRHRARLGAGRDRDAARTLAELERRAEVTGNTDQLHLAKMDRALARDGDWRTALADLFASIPMGEEALRTWRMLGQTRAPDAWTVQGARRLADAYRY